MNWDITLLRPFWLLALPLVVSAGWLLWSRRGGLGDWERVTNPALLQAMAALGRIERAPNRGPLLAGLSIIGLLALALSGPAIERRDTLSYRNLDGVLFLVDASASVHEDPRWPQLLTMGRFGLAALGTRPGGLIVFGGDAYVATEMTHDHLQLGQTFSLIEPDTVPDKGSRPGRALDLAADLLRTAQVIAGDVVVFSDGAGLGPETLRQTAQIAEQGARVSFVGFDALPSLQSHAKAGKGHAFVLSDTEALGAWLSDDARARLERQDYPLLFWHDYGRYVLILTLVPLLLLFRREGA
ncbi:MAG: VWA domain-containing protein [Pseudomonadota bacterium]